MTMSQTIWKGTEKEGKSLLDAIQQNCQCTIGEDGQRVGDYCVVHKAFVGDQRFLDGLLFVRRIRLQLIVKEFMTEVVPGVNVPH